MHIIIVGNRIHKFLKTKLFTDPILQPSYYQPPYTITKTTQLQLRNPHQWGRMTFRVWPLFFIISLVNNARNVLS